MKRMDPAEAERFLRERIAEMASHDDPTNDAAAAVLAALDAARAEVERLRAIEHRAAEISRWPDRPEFCGPYASAAHRILTGENP